MGYCKARYVIPVPGGKDVVLACFLDESHGGVLAFHFDKSVGRKGLEWRFPLEPTPVISTRTNPPKSVMSSVQTSSFEVVRT